MTSSLLLNLENPSMVTSPSWMSGSMDVTVSFTKIVMLCLDSLASFLYSAEVGSANEAFHVSSVFTRDAAYVACFGAGIVVDGGSVVGA